MQLGIDMQIQNKDGWRYSCVFDLDAPTGPFTADLIEGFCHTCHDTIDLDVSNLYVMKDYTKDLGMRIPI